MIGNRAIKSGNILIVRLYTIPKMLHATELSPEKCRDQLGDLTNVDIKKNNEKFKFLILVYTFNYINHFLFFFFNSFKTKVSPS